MKRRSCPSPEDRAKSELLQTDNAKLRTENAKLRTENAKLAADLAQQRGHAQLATDLARRLKETLQAGVFRPQITTPWRNLTSPAFPGTLELNSHKTDAHGAQVWSVAFSPDGSKIVSGSFRTFKVWDANTLKLSGKAYAHNGHVKSVAFSSDGTKIVSGSDDLTIRVWDADTLELKSGKTYAHRGRITSVAFSPDGTKIVSGSDDQTIKVWDAGMFRPQTTTPLRNLTSPAFPRRHTRAQEREGRRPQRGDQLGRLFAGRHQDSVRIVGQGDQSLARNNNIDTTLLRMPESIKGSGIGLSHPFSRTMFWTIPERHATSLSTMKISFCMSDQRYIITR
eukprot:scaffold3167_cov105-Isochrysis_galbana.AAC.7